MGRIIIRIQFKMEEVVRERKFQDAAIEHHLGSENSASATADKGGRRLKRESLRDKKKIKNLDKEDFTKQLADKLLLVSKCKSDEDHSVTSHESHFKKQTTQQTIPSNRFPFQLDRLLSKPVYLSLTPNDELQGEMGHSSAIFKRPILEGFYFLEFTVREDARSDRKTANPSAVRVGVVHYDYNPTFPIGCNQSIGYKSTDGSFIKEGEIFDRKESYGVGDVMGVLLKISPPKKIPNPKETNEGSSVSFFKNGKLILEYNSLLQQYYCFAVSVYNYAHVEINMTADSLFPMPQGATHYCLSLTQPILYKDLQDHQMFKL